MNKHIERRLSCVPAPTLVATFLFGLVFAGLLQAADEGEPDLRNLYLARDFFSLRQRLEEPSDTSSQEHSHLFFTATVQSAFNQPAASNSTIAELRSLETPPPGLEIRLLQMEIENHLRLESYARALAAANTLLARAPDSSNLRPQAYARRMLPLLTVLEDTPPQQVEIGGFSRLALGPTRRIPIEISGKKRRFALDTGANFSVIMESEAKKLGLEIRPTGLTVSTSTAKQVLADVAVADSVDIGKVHYQNVVFLVFPDEDLSFPGGEEIPGLVGFPVVNAMGEVRFRRDDVLEIPHDPPTRTIANLALNDLEPLVRVQYRREPILCRLDTGSPETDFYEPFFRMNRERIESSGKKVVATSGGVGGFQDIDAYRLARLVMTIAGAGITLRKVDIFTQPIRSPDQNYLDCNVGLDALEQFKAYTLNFRDMALILE